MPSCPVHRLVGRISPAPATLGVTSKTPQHGDEEPAMSGTHMRIKGRDRLRAGDLVEAHRDGVVHHRGIVEETVPALGVVWIRERATGNRRMLDTDDFE